MPQQLPSLGASTLQQQPLHSGKAQRDALDFRVLLHAKVRHSSTVV